MNDQVFFIQNFDELVWRSPNKHWITYSFVPLNDIDYHQVWNFLHTCPGFIGIKKVHGYLTNYDITFELETSRDKFAMYSKLSGWEGDKETDQSLVAYNQILWGGLPVPKSILRKAAGIDDDE